MSCPLDAIDLVPTQPVRMLGHVVTGGRAWLGGELARDDWTVPVTAQALAEIEHMVDVLHARPLPLLRRAPEQFHIPVLRAPMAEAKARLDSGCGFAVVDALPMDAHASEDMIACFWTLGQCIERTVAQRWDGTMIYDVTDTGRDYGYGVRGSHTRVELVFHTDNAFGVALPDYVGLLCKHPAASGGVSRFASLYTIHNRMLTHHRALLERLYRPMLFDRQAEHAPGAAPTAWAPFFVWDGQRLTARANVSLVRKGYEVAGFELDAELEDALSAVEAVANCEALWVEAPIRRGQLQYLNNRELVHYRSAFTDAGDPARRRHLLRTWHRGHGQRAYDG